MKLDGVVFLLTISREDLYGEIWSVGMSKAAKKLDIPYDKLKKACVNHDIPLPTQSYWSKLYMGNEKPSQPELPNVEDNAVITIKKAKKQQVSASSRIEQLTPINFEHFRSQTCSGDVSYGS